MKFNKSRFAKLAGLPQSRGTLNESRRRKALRRRAMLKEGMYGGRRSEMLDTFDPFDDDDVEMLDYDDFGRESLRLDQYPEYDMGGSLDDMGPEYYERASRYELDDDDYLKEGMGHMHEEDMEEGMHHMHEEDMEEGMYEEEDVDEAMYEEEDMEEDMVEIDDKELMKEVRNIKRKRINEARLKAVIEDELRDVLAEMQYGSNWMYGDNKPKASKKGNITRGFSGLGFK